MTAPAPTLARDILDFGTAAQEIAITLRFAGKGLSDAWEHDIDTPRAQLIALKTLRLAHEDLGSLIAELDSFVAEGGR